MVSGSWVWSEKLDLGFLDESFVIQKTYITFPRSENSLVGRVKIEIILHTLKVIYGSKYAPPSRAP